MGLLAVRHMQCMILFWGIALTYAMRGNLPLALLAMTDQKSTNQQFPEYQWSEKVKSLILSSFYWGYVFTQIPGGFLVRKFSGKKFILCSILLSSTGAILTPLAAQVADWPMLAAIRVLQGLAQGVLCPTIHTIISKWAPTNERAAMGTYCYNGVEFGTVTMLASCGFIASSRLGWPSIFYIPGCLGILWAIIWYIWGANSPAEHKFITPQELKYIETSLNEYAGSSQESESDAKKITLAQVPWLQFLSSPPLWALIFTQSAFSWGFLTMLTETPSYMKNVLDMDIKSNALYTALPYLIMWMLSFVFAGMASFITNKKLMSLSQNRKFFNTLAQWVPAVALIWLGYLDANSKILAIVLITTAVGMTAAMHVGYEINHIDLSPNFAGIMMGLSTTVSNLFGIVAPILVGFVVTDTTNVFQWRIIFFIAGGFCFIGNLLFIIFGRVEVQSWNKVQNKPELEASKTSA